MSATPDTGDRRKPRAQPADPIRNEIPAWRPNDEIPANRREDPSRTNPEDEDAHRDRRGS